MQITTLANLWYNSFFAPKIFPPTLKSYIDRLPDDLLKNIFNYFSSYDQLIIIPFVCKKWDSARKQKKLDQCMKSFFQDSSNFGLSHIVGSEEKLLKIIRNNDFISKLMNLNFKFQSYDIWPKKFDGEKPVPSTIKFIRTQGVSEFTINWAPNTSFFEINNSGKWGNLDTLNTLSIMKTTIFDENTKVICGIFFEVWVHNRFNCKKTIFFRWMIHIQMILLK